MKLGLGTLYLLIISSWCWLCNELRWLRYQYGLLKRPQPADLPKPLLVSLTSYPPRFPYLLPTLKSLLTQGTRAQAVELWIAQTDKDKLPKSIMALSAHGLVIRYCDDLKSYKKIIPALAENADRYIVTADDDVYYWPHWLTQLVQATQARPDTIFAYRAHTITFAPNGVPLPYKNWHFFVPASPPSSHHFPTGIGGVLYPPNCFLPEVLNTRNFTTVCANADDIWLHWMSKANGVCSASLPTPWHSIVNWPGSQKIALWKTNVLKDNNDHCIHAMLQAYGKIPVHTCHV